MSEQELRELDDFCAEHVMEWEYFDTYLDRPVWSTKDENNPTVSLYSPTLDPAASMQVLNRILDTHESPEFYKLISEESFSIKSKGDGCCTLEQGQEIHVRAATLPLAIALFAKKLFSK